jgi:hypothetical protein
MVGYMGIGQNGYVDLGFGIMIYWSAILPLN